MFKTSFRLFTHIDSLAIAGLIFYHNPITKNSRRLPCRVTLSLPYVYDVPGRHLSV